MVRHAAPLVRAKVVKQVSQSKAHSGNLMRGPSMGEWLSSRRDGAIVAWHEGKRLAIRMQKKWGELNGAKIRLFGMVLRRR